MKLKVIACGVFEPELNELVLRTPHQVHLHFLDAGLHATPDVLRERVQAEIDSAVGRGYDGLVVVYGLCGRGTSGLLARDTPVILPRVHDCMTLFLGSREEYRRQFARHPGTFYTTPGWFEKKSAPQRASGGSANADLRSDPRFPELAQKYGEANAEAIIYFYDSWKRNYTRAAFIDTGVGDRDRYERYARQMAEEFGWIYERLQGQTALLEALLAGRWDDPQLFVLHPGQRSALTGDDRIFAAVDIAAGTPPTSQAHPKDAPLPTCARRTLSLKPAAPPAPTASATPPAVQTHPLPDGAIIGLGIDAGGTYTDCVLYDMRAERVLAKAKALTTHYDLMVGINEALDALKISQPDAIRLVALSTTLATNSIVEGKGGRPGAIIMSAAPATTGAIRWQPMRVVAGEMSIEGTELVAPDPAEVAAAVDDLLAAGVDAFAVSGYASVKNPRHELLVKQIIRSRCDLPVVCGHELSSRLNYVSRANTAILNARLLPVVRELLDAVEASLVARGIHGTLMVVKGDGSLVNRNSALERPIETILSGPAASVSGAKQLTGLEDAIILDMGGTTTDTAIIAGGLVRVSPEGARVGGWQTSVEAADISTIGLGGDSYLSFTPDRKLLIGPQRVIPLAYLCHHHPGAREMLFSLDPRTVTDRSTPALLDFFTLARPEYHGPLDDRERALVHLLRQGPLSRRALAARLGIQSPALVRPRRLEQLGVIQRAALTPTDILHVTGHFRAWDTEAATCALNFFAAIFGATPQEIIQQVWQGIIERLCGQVIAKELPGGCPADPDQWHPLLQAVFRSRPEDRLRPSLTYSQPIVAIGAPVHPFFPDVGKMLGAQVIIPEHAEVANAIGAIASEVVVRERAVVRPGEIANYVLYTRSGRTEFQRLHEAVESAKHQAAALAQERARQSGTSSQQVRYHVDERRAFSAAGEEVLVEVLVEATVSGKPELQAAC